MIAKAFVLINKCLHKGFTFFYTTAQKIECYVDKYEYVFVLQLLSSWLSLDVGLYTINVV